MAHSLSARKRVRQDAKKRVINRARKSMVKTEIKHFEDALKKGDVEKAGQELVLVQKKLDKVAATSTMHKNTASRMKSHLTKRFNALKAAQA